jgi:ActR/RegA family two-component response regulator
MQRGDTAAGGGILPKILIVDDDEIIAVALYRHLIASGMPVELAVDADGASTLLASHQYALIVLDAYLTGQLHSRALQFIDTVRALQPEAQILLLTAYGSPALAEYVKPYARITVVRKPQSIPYLAELIEGFVAGRSTP